MSEVILTVRNNHTPACGVPPEIRAGGSLYVGYFENRYGEQWIFTFDRATREATVRGGDVGWAEIRAVRDGRADVLLNDDEAAWLRACWNAATA